MQVRHPVKKNTISALKSCFVTLGAKTFRASLDFLVSWWRKVAKYDKKAFALWAFFDSLLWITRFILKPSTYPCITIIIEENRPLRDFSPTNMWEEMREGLCSLKWTISCKECHERMLMIGLFIHIGAHWIYQRQPTIARNFLLSSISPLTITWSMLQSALLHMLALPLKTSLWVPFQSRSWAEPNHFSQSSSCT